MRGRAGAPTWPSSRLSGGMAAASSTPFTLPAHRSCCQADAGTAAAADPEPEDEPELQYDDSSVRRYVCQVLAAAEAGAACGSTSSGVAGTIPEGARVAGFRRLPGCLHDPALARAYSVDSRPGLVAVRQRGSIWRRCCAVPCCGCNCLIRCAAAGAWSARTTWLSCLFFFSFGWPRAILSDRFAAGWRQGWCGGGLGQPEAGGRVPASRRHRAAPAQPQASQGLVRGLLSLCWLGHAARHLPKGLALKYTHTQVLPAAHSNRHGN